MGSAKRPPYGGTVHLVCSALARVREAGGDGAVGRRVREAGGDGAVGRRGTLRKALALERDDVDVSRSKPSPDAGMQPTQQFTSSARARAAVFLLLWCCLSSRQKIACAQLTAERESFGEKVAFFFPGAAFRTRKMEKEDKMGSTAAASTRWTVFCIVSWFALNMVRRKTTQ